MPEDKRLCDLPHKVGRTGMMGITGMLENRPGQGEVTIYTLGVDGALSPTTEKVTAYNIFFQSIAPSAFCMICNIDGMWFIDAVDAIP